MEHCSFSWSCGFTQSAHAAPLRCACRRPSGKPASSSGLTASRVRAAGWRENLAPARLAWLCSVQNRAALQRSRQQQPGGSSGGGGGWRAAPPPGVPTLTSHCTGMPPCPAGYGFITLEDSEDEVFVHQASRRAAASRARRARRGRRWRGVTEQAAALLAARSAASRRRHLRCLPAAPLPRPQSNIETSGYRSLQEGEEVEFELVVGEDGKKKAYRVTGPGGAPPQVRCMHRSLACLRAWLGCADGVQCVLAACCLRRWACFCALRAACWRSAPAAEDAAELDSESAARRRRCAPGCYRLDLAAGCSPAVA